MKKDANTQLREAIRAIVSEAMPSMARVDQTVAQDGIEEDAMDEAMEIAQEAVYRFHQKLQKTLRGTLNTNLVGVETPTPGPGQAYGKSSMQMMFDQLEGPITDLQMECASDVEHALTKYAKAVAQLAARAAHEDFD